MPATPTVVFVVRTPLLAAALLAAAVATARADEPAGEPDAEPVRRRDASTREIFAGPFRSSHLFAMPVADVVGAYQISLAGDGSLLQETGILTSAGVLAIGFGDLAQLEYRHTAAISLGRTIAPLPAAGVQLKLPLSERRYLPAFSVALRFGLARDEELDDGRIATERVTDFYAVSRLRLWGRLSPVTLHAGVRVSKAEISVDEADAPAPELVEKTLVLPAFGWEIATGGGAHLVGELMLAPQFDLDTATGDPTIGAGLLGRLGVRWFVRPAVILDASLGYQVEVARAEIADGLNSIVQWDIRLGGEVFVPWGALVCRAAGVFCE